MGVAWLMLNGAETSLLPFLIYFLAVLLLALVFALRPIASRDLGFHLRTGQWIVQEGEFPGKDVFTYSHPLF